MYTARNLSIKANVKLYTDGREADKEALLDSGATENIIHHKLIRKHHLPTIKLTKERQLLNVNGTTNQLGSIKEVVVLAIWHKGGLQSHKFLVADIGEDSLILEYPFLKATNHKIDWSTGRFGTKVTLFNCQKVTITQQLTEQATDKTEQTWQEIIPKCYHQHDKVFSEPASERFPD